MKFANLNLLKCNACLDQYQACYFHRLMFQSWSVCFWSLFISWSDHLHSHRGKIGHWVPLSTSASFHWLQLALEIWFQFSLLSMLIQDSCPWLGCFLLWHTLFLVSKAKSSAYQTLANRGSVSRLIEEANSESDFWLPLFKETENGVFPL